MKFDWYTAFVTTGCLLLAVIVGLSLIAAIAYWVVGEPRKTIVAWICFFLGFFLLAGISGGAA